MRWDSDLDERGNGCAGAFVASLLTTAAYVAIFLAFWLVGHR